ncbi:endolytic transglycosylase MltG [Mycobacterium decipiens]|uniref:Endolytic murein transglycosylase n=1 Tax=Mycobacterium decipiens TaxID=1430326 RepID=A0A1X2LPC7_9MYCO|nr:endolytic transglycosylase MltG [Mycobacterium decipiens]OSC37127.1 aminodeoxychorismate lyase [Mycobacterium decipiens]
MSDGGHRHRAQPVSVGPNRHRTTRGNRAQHRHAHRLRRRRRAAGGIALVALVAVAVAAVVVGAKLWHSVWGSGDDYSGTGRRDIVIQVKAGDSTTAVGETLLKYGVVATVRAFVDAAHGNAAISSIQPGFYRVRTEIPAAAAVARLTDPNNRVGRLVIPEGRQLDDTTDMKTNVVNPGIFSLISRATCVDLDGTQRCVSVADLRAAAGKSTPAMLSVPRWAVQPVLELGNDHRRIEGLIAPGTFNIDPSASAETILATLISAGAVEYMKSGLVDTAKSLSLSPYDILVVASLVQQEANTQDFPKVARVIYNRLNERRSLEFDSTVNYPLDRREVATSDADRAQRTPWNTYVSEGLPATAICSPGVDALRAAEHPAPGDWLYFVTIDAQGTTLFTRDYQQHLANIELAKHNGVLDSAR